MFRIWVPDLDSPSYFVAVAAVDLGLFKEEGVDVEFVYKATDGPERMRDGDLQLIGGPAYAATRAFPGWKGAKLLCALSQYSYWFLGLRADINAKRGDLQGLKGLRLSAAETWPIMGLRYMLAHAGFDLERDNIRLVPPPPAYGDKGYMARNGVTRSRRTSPMAFGATECELRSAKVSVLRNCISICGAVTVLPAQGTTIFPH